MQDKTKVAYGVDVLRLWAATVEYWKDMSIGPTVIAQVAESLRKLRNSARFCLANLGPPEALAKMERVPKAEMGYVRRLFVSFLRARFVLIRTYVLVYWCRLKNTLCMSYII